MKSEIMVIICDIHGDASRDDNTIDLPATDEEIAEAMEKAEIPSPDRCDVVGWKCNMHFLNERLEDEISSGLGCGVKVLNELNFLAGRLSRMSDYERALFEGMAKCCDIRDLKGLINTTYNLQNPYLMPGICSVQELGEDYIKGVKDKIPGELAGYVSAEAAGRYMLNENQGAFTDAGYVVDSMIDSDPVYDGNELPGNEESYTSYFRLKLASAADYDRLGSEAPTVVLKLPEPGYPEEAEKLACLRLGVGSLDECVVVEPECFEPLLAGIMDGTRLSEVYAFTAELYEAECCGVGFYRFFAALESYGIEMPDLKTAKEALARSYDFGHYIDIHSVEDYGRQCLKENFSRDESNLAVKVIDLKAYGENMMRENNAVLTSHGMVVRPEDFGRPEQGEAPQMGGMTL